MPNINKNIIKQAGAAVANAANKAAGLSASTPEPGSIISAIQLVNGGRTIGPDALAHFTESVRNKLLSLLVSLEPIQDLNGYTRPWPAGGGKNLFDKDNANTLEAYINGSGVINSSGNDITAYIKIQKNKNIAVSFTQIALSTAPLYDDTQIGLYTSQPVIGLAGTRVYTGRRASATQDFSFQYTGNSGESEWIALKIGNVTRTDITATMATLQIEYGSSPTSYAPYSNICPISGRTGAHAYVSPTPNVADAATYSMDWTSPAGTVYAGSADIVTGDIKAAPYYASYNGETLVGPWVSSMDVYDPEGTPTTGAQVVDLGGSMTEYHITGQDIITLVGDNYIWSDSGDVTITE